MALMKCPECGREISDQSETCIHCGYPLKKESKEAENPSAEEKVDSLEEEKVEEIDPREQDDETVEMDGSVEEDETADQETEETEETPAVDEKITSTEKLSGIKKALHPILSGIHKIAPGPLKKVRPVYILSSFILIIAIIAGVVGYNVYESNTLKGPEITAAKCIKEYKSMMKDPASFTLCGNPLVVDGGYAGESSAGKTLIKTFVYIPASGTNSYGGMVTGVGVFVNGDYLCDIDDIKKQDDVDEEYLTKLYAALHYVGWSNYGDEYRDESIKEGYPISKATEVSAEKIGKNLHVKVDID